MDVTGIKAAIRGKGYTLREFSSLLGVAYGTLRQVLCGRRPLTPALRNHILLVLSSDCPRAGSPCPSELFVFFRVYEPSSVVELLGGSFDSLSPSERKVALTAISDYCSVALSSL